MRGFTCFFSDENCDAGEHCVVDCGVDVLLGKLGDGFDETLTSDHHDGTGPARRLIWTAGGKGNIAMLGRGQSVLEGLYDLMKRGEYEYGLLDFAIAVGAGNGMEALHDDHDSNEDDRAVMEKLGESLRNELDCQICYSLILDPVTIPCGHTFCQNCVARILDHSSLCPACRRKIGLPPSSIQSRKLVNGRIAGLVDLLYPGQVAARRSALIQEESGLNSADTVPLFVCSLSFPTLPMFLHVFEPRYRLMIRRVMDSGGGKFGMLMVNRNFDHRLGGDGRPPFMLYGTMLTIIRFQLLPDGRSLVLAMGLSRFKVIEWGVLDGYDVGKIERVDDVPLAEEESMEAAETAASNHSGGENTDDSNDNNEENGDGAKPLDSMSTQQLLQEGLDFVLRQRAQGSPWLRPHNPLPSMPTDADRFAWWLACLLRVPEELKYLLLRTSRVRERLKMIVSWTRKLGSEEGYVHL